MFFGLKTARASYTRLLKKFTACYCMQLQQHLKIERKTRYSTHMTLSVAAIELRRYRPQTISATDEIGHRPHRPQPIPYRPQAKSVSATDNFNEWQWAYA